MSNNAHKIIMIIKMAIMITKSMVILINTIIASSL